MSNKELVICTLYLLHISEKAMLVSRNPTYPFSSLWLPLSQIDKYEEAPIDTLPDNASSEIRCEVTMTIPKWLADKNALHYLEG